MADKERTPYGVERTVLRHPVLGKLVWNARVRWWEGDIPDQGEAVFFADGEESPDPGYASRVHERLSAVMVRIGEARAFAEAKLGDRARTGWSGVKPSFDDAVTLSSVALRGDGTAEVWLDGGVLFQGDGIIVVLDSSNAPVDARLTED